VADSQTFQGIDLAKWEHFRELVLNKAGIGINSLVGNGSAKGITLSWSYSPDAQALVITLAKGSFYDPSKQDIGTDISAMVKAA
jgi:hypothetical protein